MILKNAKIFSDGLIREGAILIEDGMIKKLMFKSSKKIILSFLYINRSVKKSISWCRLE